MTIPGGESAAKHTPGPNWELSGLRFSDNQQNSETYGVDDFPVYAAAPDLLEACDHAEAVMSIVEPRSDKAEYLECLQKLRAALAKAEPRT